MQRPDRSLVLALLAAGAVSFLAGFAFTQAIERVPCRGETLACNIDQAIGAYGVVIWAILGPLIFGLTLFIARNRIALAGAFAVLLAPPVAFFLISQIEHTLYVGLEPQRQFRTFLVTFAPPALTVLVQYLILRLVVPPTPERPQ
jgi:hypothetical protein